MRFEVGFIAEVEAVAVAETGETGIVRIMAGTDEIDVVPLEQDEIGNHVLRGRRCAQLRVAVVAVDALCLDLSAVDVHHLAAHLEFPYADRLPDDLAADRQVQRVKARRLIAPEHRTVDVKRQRAGAIHVRTALAERFSVGRDKPVADLCRTAERYVRSHGRARKRLPGFGADKEILHVDLVPQEQIDLADDAGGTDFVLILQVGSVAPLENQHTKLVLARVQEFRHIDFAGHVADLAVGGELPVDVEIEAGVHALEVQSEIIFFQCVRVHVQRAPVQSAGVLCRSTGMG